MHDAWMETGHRTQVNASSSGTSAPPPLKLSIVIPTRDRREVLISRTLPAMFSQDIPVDDFEIVVVVDGSTDGTAHALRELRPPCSLRVIEQSNRGPSAARNAGIQAARGELLLFVDDDIICGPHLFRWHVEAHSDSGPAVAFGPISMAPDAPPSVLKYENKVWFEDYYRRIEAQNGLNLPKDDYLISNSSIPRATLVECSGFDETMTAKEDYELGLRLWKRGLRFKFLPQAAAYEFFQKPIQYVLRTDGKAFGETDVLLARKHPEYRPYSTLAPLGKMVWWKRSVRRMLSAVPFSPVGVLSPPLWICDKLCRFSAMRRLSRYLLGVGRGIVVYTAAARKIGSWQALEREFGQRLPVLLYHHVGPEYPGAVRGLTVSPERFERHVSWLARRGFKGICPIDWLRWRQEGKSLPTKPILFTFDDGYADLAEYALPVLHRYGFGAAVYIVTRQLGGTNVWDAARGAPLSLITAGQIRFWASQGIDFGAHSRTHADLRDLPARELSEEVVGSGKDLEAILGTKVVSFAYPYGFHNRAVDDCVRSAFDLAFIADDENEGLNSLETDPHQLLRTMVQSSDSLLAMKFRSRWGRYPFLNLLSRIRVRIALRTRLRHAMGVAVHGNKR
jgi:peptidoglycan/xylan/chitin deacetylase (PgdA/CDA1 family)